MRLTFPKINQVILIIIVSEFILITAFGFLPPFFAVFVTEQIVGGTVAVVGFAITIYWVTKSILQLFVARYIDRNHGEIDDFYFFITGVFANSIIVASYYLVTQVWQVYTLHFLMAVADAALVPPFYAIFTRHVDKGQEGFSWSLYSSFSLGAGSALGGAVGGVLGLLIGFRALFLLTGLLTFISAVALLFLKPHIKPKVPQEVPRIFIDKRKI